MNAFTLAEVLITLAIIGVVAALTMPAVVANYQKKEAISKLKKSYSALMQAKQRAELDHGNYIYWNRGDNAEEYIKTFWLPYFNVIQICTSHSICGYESNKPWSMLSGNLNDWQVAKLDTRIAFLTADGIFYAISLDGEQPEELILIDINAGKKPNLTGKDLFLFVINDKGIFPRDYDKSKEEINRNCKKNSSNGYSCAAKIMRAGWEMERDYPW